MRRTRSSSSSPVLEYLLAGVTIVVTTAALHLLRGVLSTPIVALAYLLPIGLASAAWGLRAGIVASLAAFVAFNYFFLDPYFTLIVHEPRDVLALIIFLIVAVVISELVGRARSSLAEARARERDTMHLYELSIALAGLRSAEAIAQTVASHLREVLQASMVEVVFQADPRAASMAIRAPADGVSPEGRPDPVVPLMSARGLIGEIHVWRAEPLFSPANDRLLRAFAGQAALALERAMLGQADTRAKILEESDRLKSALLSSVSHELRTPLATIKAAATSLRGGEIAWDTPAREDLLAVIDEEADHLNRLVGNLLDMSRIESGALQPHRQWNSLAEIVGGTVAQMRRAAERHHLEIDVPEDLPLVPVDHVLMDQVFTNLISNCLKYAPPDTTVRVHARVQDDRSVLVQVSNQGPPVPEEHLDRIFDKFYRVTAADRVTGTGLGLSICKGILEAHAGRIWAVNLPGGFAFNFSLPLTWDGALPSALPAESEPA